MISPAHGSAAPLIPHSVEHGQTPPPGASSALQGDGGLVINITADLTKPTPAQCRRYGISQADANKVAGLFLGAEIRRSLRRAMAAGRVLR